MKGVPIIVQPVLKKDEMWNATLGLNMTVGFDPVNVTAKSSHMMAQTKGVPVYVDPVLMKDEMADFHFGNKILVGQDYVTYTKTPAKK